jgi:anti-sigma factor RsiW
MTHRPSPYRQPISEIDLHGYIDGELSAQRRAEVDAYLAAHPDQAARLASYSSLTLSLHTLYGDGGGGANRTIDSLTADFDRALRRRRMAHRLARVAVAVLVVATGAAVASGVHDRFRQAEDRFLAFTRQATEAHVLFAGNKPVPRDAALDEETAVVTWLSQRLTGVPVRAPDLQAFGYELSVERILPSPGGPAAQLMYESRKSEEPITLFIGKSRDMKPTAFTFVQNDDLSIFYWQEGPFAYSLAGNLDRTELLALAEEVNAQLVALPPLPKPMVQHPAGDSGRAAAAEPPPSLRGKTVDAEPAAAGSPTVLNGGLVRPVSNTLDGTAIGIDTESAKKQPAKAGQGETGDSDAPKPLITPRPKSESEAPKKTS